MRDRLTSFASFLLSPFHRTSTDEVCQSATPPQRRNLSLEAISLFRMEKQDARETRSAGKFNV